MNIKHFHFKEVGSTNDLAKELLGEYELVAVTAEYQTQGRGRNERTWVGNSGENVYCSIGIRHQQKVSYQKVMLFQVLGAMIAVNSLRRICQNPQDFRLKYPNDVMALMKNGEYGKICGVLAEHSFQGEYCIDTIIGIGLNVNQIEFRGVTHNIPVSLNLIGEDFDSSYVAEELIKEFVSISKMDLNSVFHNWGNELNFIGKHAKVVGRAEAWIIEELLDDGRVRLSDKNTDNTLIIDNGDSIRYDFKA